MEKNNELKKSGAKNCIGYCFDDTINTEDF